MGPDVSFHATSYSTRIAALTTGVGLLSGVSALMYFPINSSREGLVTYYAFKWFTTSMNPMMYLQFTFTRETLSTFIAGMNISSYNLHVRRYTINK